MTALTAAVLLTGCGGSATRHPKRANPAIVQAQARHEYPSSPPPRQTASAAWPSPSGAVEAFAKSYINWDADTVSAEMRRLAASSIGQARATAQLAAAQTAGDYELQRGGIANHGTVEAVVPLRGGRNGYLVVTRELTTATATTAYQGLQPAWHVAIASVAEVGPDRWVVSGWEPQS